MRMKGPRATLSAGLAGVLAFGIIGTSLAHAQAPPRFYWKSLVGGNAVPVIFQSLSGNANPIDPGHVVSANADVEANVATVGYARVFALFDRTLTVALLEPVGRISGDTTVAGRSFDQSASGFGDPMLELSYSLIGPKAIRDLPDLMRYQPKFSLDLLVDVAFPIGDYDDDQPLNLGQNRWYGRVGVPVIWQIGPWVPGQRMTVELLPSVWWFTDNSDYVGTRLETDPMFQLDAHLTRDFTQNFWGSADLTYMAGAKSTIDGVEGDSLNTLGLGVTLGYQITDNIQLTAGYASTVNDSGSTDLEMDGFKLSFTYGWHKLLEGAKRLKEE